MMMQPVNDKSFKGCWLKEWIYVWTFRLSSDIEQVENAKRKDRETMEELNRKIQVANQL